MLDDTYPCGHPRTPENSRKRAGLYYPDSLKCRTCVNERARKSMARKRTEAKEVDRDRR
jgi:hypothetical protein